MSCVIDAIVGKILDPIFDYLFASIGRQIGYLVKYKENIENLEKEVNDLKGVRDRVQGAVNRARDNGMTIDKDAEKWLEEVQQSLTTLEEEMNKSLQDKANLKCLDVRSRYRLGKNGKKMVKDAIRLKEDRNKFGDQVAHPTPLKDIWYTSNTAYENFDSRNLVFEEIKKALTDDKNSKIGIYGMPGVGKTTMAKEVGKQAGKGPFDEVAMVVFSQNPDLKKIQGKLADCLNLKLDAEGEEGRAGQLYNRLNNGKKILLIFDDVWDDQITPEKIGIRADIVNSMGCKILLTSRRLEVCNRMGFEKTFPIGLLSGPEAWHLFRRTVGDFIEADPEIQSLAQQVCRECDHLPLAICAVGGALSGEKDKHVWNDAVEQLKHCQGYKIDGVEEKVYSCIEWSYRYLKQSDVQSCFLHCSLFLEDSEISIDSLVYLGVGMKFLESTDRTSMKKARDRTHVMVGILKKSSLLLEGGEEHMFKMHDVVRDVAISIASKPPNLFLVKDGIDVWPDKDDYKSCKIISIVASSKVRKLPDQLDCQGLRTLVLRCTDRVLLELPNSLFEGMEKLEVLVLEKMKLAVSSLSNLASLRMLSLEECELVNPSFLDELKNLEILIIGHIYKSEEIVFEKGQLARLRLLDLSNFNKDTRFLSGFLSRLSDLEELYISKELQNEWEVEGNASIVELNSLSNLTALEEIFIPKDVFLQLPKDLPSFKSLTKYNIWIGFENSRYYYKEHAKTKILGLEGVPLMVGLHFLMANAEVLYLIKLEGLKKVLIDADREWFLDLQHLRVRNCDDLEHLPGKPKRSLQTHGPCPLGSFGKLRILHITECRSMTYLFSPSTARGLPKLQVLLIRCCEKMEGIIGGDEEVLDKVIFHQLGLMFLHNLPNFISIYANMKKTPSTTECKEPSTIKQSLFNEKVMFPVLKYLVIVGLNNFKAIWDKQLLPVLKAGDSFKHLRELDVRNCKEMEEILAFEIGPGEEEAQANDEIVLFPKLKIIDLQNLPNLKISPDEEIDDSSGISQDEEIDYDSRLQALVNHKVKFPKLENFNIQSDSDWDWDLDWDSDFGSDFDAKLELESKSEFE